MIDTDLLVYSGTLALFVLAVLVIGTIMLVLFTAVAITASIPSRRKTGIQPDAGEQRWFWRQGSGSAGLDEGAGQSHTSGDYPPLTPDVDPHSGRWREDAAGAQGGRHDARLRPSRVPPAPPRQPRKTKRAQRNRKQPAT